MSVIRLPSRVCEGLDTSRPSQPKARSDETSKGLEWSTHSRQSQGKFALAAQALREHVGASV